MVTPVGAEFLFVLLPLIALAVVYISEDKSVHDVLKSAEWSFGASILFGQAVVKLASGAMRTGVENWGTATSIIAGVLVFGLTPSLAVLIVILMKEVSGSVISNTLIAEQLALFVVGSVAFFILGAMGHYGLSLHLAETEG
jgi:hypothetical protein